MRPGAGLSNRAHVAIAISCAMTLTGCVNATVNADREAFIRSPERNAIPSGVADARSSQMLLLDVRLDRQIAANGCGAHAVASLVDYWLRLAPSETTAEISTGAQIYARTPPKDSSGYTLAEVADLLRSQGLEALAVASTSDALKAELRAGRPAIVRVTLRATELRPIRILPDQPALLAGIETLAFRLSSRVFGMEQLDHYWLVIGYDDSRVVVLDPAMGVRSVSPAAFETAFSEGGRLAVVSGGWR